jgi:hypothetical protein
MKNDRLEGLQNLLADIKYYLHNINNQFFLVSKSTGDIRELVIALWIRMDDYRESTYFEPDSLYDVPFQKVAGQAYRMWTLTESKKKSELEKEFLVLRQYVISFEKSIVKQCYYAETGIIASKIITIKLTSKLSKKSEITIRRYIKSKKIFAYKVLKIWWVPFEETQKIKKG